MNPSDFGTPGPRRRSRYRRPTKENPVPFVKWGVVGTGTFAATGTTRRQLPAGAYVGHDTVTDGINIKAKDLQVDDWIELPEGAAADAIQEIAQFWSLGDQYGQLGLLHRRGFLFYGPQGSGKSSVVKQIVHRSVLADHAAFFCENPGTFLRTMELFRHLEPERPVVCLFEDIDAIIEEHGDTELLQWLDGYQQINHVINLATTNYPEKLDRRILCRPRRFDRILKIEATSPAQREAYLVRKRPDLAPKELRAWVKRTQGLSFAALAELVISVCCLGRDFDATIERLRTMEGQRISSKDFDRAGGMGFGQGAQACE